MWCSFEVQYCERLINCRNLGPAPLIRANIFLGKCCCFEHAKRLLIRIPMRKTTNSESAGAVILPLLIAIMRSFPQLLFDGHREHELATARVDLRRQIEVGREARKAIE